MKTVFFGDSITAGFTLLKQHKNVINLGVSGDKTIDLIGRFMEVIRAKPEQLFVMIGSNDYLVRKKVWQDYVNIDYPLLLKALFTLMKDNLQDVDIHILSIPPIRIPEILDVESANRDIDAINEIVQQQATLYEFDYIDVASALKSLDNGLNPEYTIDGVHLSEAGYKTYYNIIKTYL